MARTMNTGLMLPRFVADEKSVHRDSGRQIDWANVPADGSFGPTGQRVLPAGLAMGTLLSGGRAMSPRVVTTNPAVGLLETPAIEDDRSAALSGYGLIKAAVVYDALLPQATGTPRVLPSAIKTELNTAGVGSFQFALYEDTP